MRKKNLSFNQRVMNAWGSQEVENVRALHAFGHARNLSTREWGQIWSTSPETAWAHSFGRNRGFEAIWRICVANYDIKGAVNYLKLYDENSDALGFDMRSMMMVAMHMLSTEYIEVADSGMVTFSTSPSALNTRAERVAPCSHRRPKNTTA